MNVCIYFQMRCIADSKLASVMTRFFSVETFGAPKNIEKGGNYLSIQRLFCFRYYFWVFFFLRPGFSDKKATHIPGMTTDEVNGIVLS